MKSKGFTLIELLIVVAIIAILAAIAVPNFLEAQTRARVTKVKSEMRTVALWLEAYRLDNNAYINPRYPAPLVGRNTFGAWFLFRETYSGGVDGIGVQLTTPIAYFTSSSIFFDPFWSAYLIDPAKAKASKGFGGIAQASFWYASDPVKRLNFGIAQPPLWFNDIVYWMQSAGPNLLIFSDEQPWAVYNPTNGVVSLGDILYVGTPGPGFL